MIEVITFPDAVELVIDYLADVLPDYGNDERVVSEVPLDRETSPRFTRVLCTGGVKHTVITEWVRITVQSWAADAITAGDDNEVCRALIGAMAGTVQSGVPVYAVNEISRPQQQPDPISESPRSVFTVELHVRGSLLTPGS